MHTRPDLSVRVLDRALGQHLYLLDAGSGAVLAASRDGAPPRDRTRVDVRGRYPCVLVAVPSGPSACDPTVLHHLGGIIALELEYEAAQRDRSQETGAALLAGLLDGDMAFPVVAPELARRGLGGALCLACWTTGAASDADIAGLRHEPRLRATPPLLLHRGGELHGIVPEDGDLAEHVAGLLGEGGAAGLSAPLGGATPVTEALAQARLALARAGETGRRAVRYGEVSAAGLLPRTVGEAREIARRVLGPLTDYDAAHDTDLCGTVRAYLDHDRSWHRTAGALGIHRQTLAYRLRNAERLTGLRIASTHGTATLWLAFQSADRTAGPGGRRAETPPAL